ncbi:hypothetical protein CHS0354_018377 [Potamilus streckersoni]|uniref:PrdX deacylase domain-containing protein 1 n=1 Tax=Potamilus streckersoni TaxID=2493646 RepID=A0AAE0TB54_9BIVA|nr:hypothetical protein CHS0354_018377 [Potamilus streckersoni]
MMSERELLAFLDECGINYRLERHEAVYTVEQSDRIQTGLSGKGTKNLFLRDKKGTRNFLVVADKHKQADLKALTQVLKADRLSFGSPERLKDALGILPGSVTVLSCINDTDKRVELYIDRDIWEADSITCHPLSSEKGKIELTGGDSVNFKIEHTEKSGFMLSGGIDLKIFEIGAGIISTTEKFKLKFDDSANDDSANSIQQKTMVYEALFGIPFPIFNLNLALGAGDREMEAKLAFADKKNY